MVYQISNCNGKGVGLAKASSSSEHRCIHSTFRCLLAQRHVLFMRCAYLQGPGPALTLERSEHSPTVKAHVPTSCSLGKHCRSLSTVRLCSSRQNSCTHTRIQTTFCHSAHVRGSPEVDATPTQLLTCLVSFHSISLPATSDESSETVAMHQGLSAFQLRSWMEPLHAK
eukprot:763170-Hanusia_phi.AAC.3